MEDERGETTTLFQEANLCFSYIFLITNFYKVYKVLLRFIQCKVGVLEGLA